MLFLLNDHVLTLDAAAAPEPGRFEALGSDFVVSLGQELFADQPMLHREDLGRAVRLAQLIHETAPDVNAALFIAPAEGCRPDEVHTRLTTVPEGVMSELHRRDQGLGLTPVAADRQVWRRMAA